MLESGYEAIEQIYRSEKTLVYRGRRISDGLSVVIKTHRDEYPSVGLRARFHNEKRLGEILASEYNLAYYSLENVGHRLLLVMEDCGAIGLRELIPEQGFELEDFLPLAIQIVSALSEIHRQNVIHKDIKPDNIIINAGAGVIKIIDFGIAGQIRREIKPEVIPAALEGTLAYIAPEQTGRMNRPLDYRGDFYSLGVTFFQMLTGRLPFESKDPLELVHAHIARTPPSPDEIRPELPPALVALVAKLTAKNAEERYQSSQGILDDLKKCQESLSDPEAQRDFKIGLSDDRDRFTHPRKLYGRERELDELLSAFERIQDNGRELLLVTGYSGIGKSSLVKEIYIPVIEKNGYFIAGGKFEQFNRNIPYSAVARTLGEFCERLLGGSQEELANWKRSILRSLGHNAGLLLELIPELVHIIGPQPPASLLPPEESRNRLNMLLCSFIKAVGDSGRPLVIFLDDLQWADSGSLSFIKSVLIDERIKNFLLIGAYRDNEVDEAHPLEITLQSSKGAGGGISYIHLAEIPRAGIQELISDSFALEGQKLSRLTNLVTSKTGGNAFFTLSLLESLTRERLLEFNYHTRQWEYDIEKIRHRDIADNLADMMTALINELPPESQKTINIAACLGNRFELGTLAIVCERSPEATLIALLDAIRDGLILALDDNYRIVAAGDEQSPPAWFKFLHDRVQQAAYNLGSDGRRKAQHLRIGRLLLTQFKNREEQAETDESIFPIPGHYNQARDLLEDPEEIKIIIQLNLQAARKARMSSAFREARAYLEAALSLLPADAWQNDYELRFAINRLMGEVLQGEGEFLRAEECLRKSRQMARTSLERVDIHAFLVMFYTNQFRIPEALEEGRRGLELLGIELVKNNYEEDIQKQKEIFDSLVGDRKIDSLSDSARMTDPESILAMKVFGNLNPATLMSDLNLFMAMAVQRANFTLEKGLAPESPLAYSGCGVVLIAYFGEFARGLELGRLGLTLLDRIEGTYHKAEEYYFHLLFFAHWEKHIRARASLEEAGYRYSQDAGEFQNMGYFLSERLNLSYYTGTGLLDLNEQIKENLNTIRKLELQPVIPMIYELKLGLEGLLPGNDNDSSPEAAFAGQYLKQDESPNNFMAFNYNVVAMREKLVLRDIDAALYHVNQAQKYSFNNFISRMSTLENRFLRPLVLLEARSEGKFEGAESENVQKLIDSDMQDLRRWSLICPENFLHWYKLARAEYESRRGELFKAQKLYEEAIATAARGEFIHNQALACELAARFSFSQGLKISGQNYLRQAYYLYEVWGAGKKIKQLEREYGISLFSQSRQDVPAAGGEFGVNESGHTSVSSSPSGASATTSGTHLLDLQSLIKCSNSIIQEVRLAGVLEQILEIMIENAGAERGVIILEREGKLFLEAERFADRRDSDIVAGTQVREYNFNKTQSESEEKHPLAYTAINYVARKKEVLLSGDALNDSRYSGDVYIRENKIRSLLCLPVFKRRKLTAILYLENNLNTAVFTKDRLELLNLLSAQFSIALDNARLYDNLEERVRLRTEELEKTHRELLETAHRAGMAEVAAGVLHNVGNALNSALVPAGLLREKLEESRLDSLTKVIELVRKNRDNLGTFFTRDERGKKLPVYLESLNDKLKGEREGMWENLERLSVSLDYIKELIRLQESYTGGEQLKEDLNLKEILEDALQMEASALERAEIKVIRDLNQAPSIRSGRHKLMIIILNLLSNAREAVLAKKNAVKEIRLYVEPVYNNKVRLHVEDQGEGIPMNLLEKIFQNGFSMRKDGRGFGLHNAANAAIELGGRLWAHSAGTGSGATFVLELPRGSRVV